MLSFLFKLFDGIHTYGQKWQNFSQFVICKH